LADDWAVPTISLVGATIVATANYFVQRWRFRIDRLKATIDDISATINFAADRATEYWLLDAKTPEEQTKCRKHEAELLGLQIRIQQLLAALKEQDRHLDLSITDDDITELYDAMTGGQFGGNLRGVDLFRPRRVQVAAGILNGSLRKALSKRSYQLW